MAKNELTKKITRAAAKRGQKTTTNKAGKNKRRVEVTANTGLLDEMSRKRGYANAKLSAEKRVTDQQAANIAAMRRVGGVVRPTV